MNDDPAVITARVQALAARARLDASLMVAKQRLNPRALAADAVGSAADKASLAAQTGIQAVRDRPAVVAAVTGAVGLALAHKPIRGWMTSMMRRGDETAPSDASSET